MKSDNVLLSWVSLDDSDRVQIRKLLQPVTQEIEIESLVQNLFLFFEELLLALTALRGSLLVSIGSFLQPHSSAS